MSFCKNVNIVIRMQMIWQFLDGFFNIFKWSMDTIFQNISQVVFHLKKFFWRNFMMASFTPPVRIDVVGNGCNDVSMTGADDTLFLTFQGWCMSSKFGWARASITAAAKIPFIIQFFSPSLLSLKRKGIDIKKVIIEYFIWPSILIFLEVFELPEWMKCNWLWVLDLS